jgi:hypothetical protein
MWCGSHCFCIEDANILVNFEGRLARMDSTHVATGAVTALLATVLFYLSHWPPQPLDLPTASAFAGLLVAAGGGAVKFYKSRTASVAAPLAPIVPANLSRELSIAG